MPVKTDKLLQLLCLMFLTYWLLKAFLVSVSVSEEMEQEVEKHFTQKIIDVNNVRYVSKLTYLEFLEGLNKDPNILKDFINILQTPNLSQQ